jgi:hypothetical protein
VSSEWRIHAPPTPTHRPFRYFNSSPEVIRLVVMAAALRFMKKALKLH